jgi:Icc-related predicted phosphoesterase
MKIQLASDLHLEFIHQAFPGEKLITPAPEAELLILAGDIANGAVAIKLFQDWPVPVLYVAGNHEYYGGELEFVRDELRNAALHTPVQFLENKSIYFDDYRFLGCTLWTDYRLYKEWSQSFLMVHAEHQLNDHQRIQTGHGSFKVFTAARALYEHEYSAEWLDRELRNNYARKNIVITHHGPHLKSVHPRYEEKPLNAAFVSNLEHLMKRADYWLHGHVHDNVDYTHCGCHVIANPLGYAQNWDKVSDLHELQFENKLFQRSFVIDIG